MQAIAAISLTRLRELWFHTGTACNLECPFCFEGSKPGDTRLERLTLEEIKPFVDRGAQLGAERFCFTGGEPLIVKDIVKILSYTLQRKPCLLISNGTAPLIKRVHQLQLLKDQPHAVSFRVSIDVPDAERHDAGRGWGNFKRAIEGVRLLTQEGFAVGILRRSEAGEDAQSVERQFQELLRKQGLPPLKVSALPELGRPYSGMEGHPPTAAEVAAATHPTQCSVSRMVLKKGGQVRVYACPFTNDDDRFDLGPALDAAASVVRTCHARCGQCVRTGVAMD